MSPRACQPPLSSIPFLPRLLLALVALLAGSPVVAGDAPYGLPARIDAQIAQPRFARADWGIAVVSLDSGHTVYAHLADRLLQPASTAKLFTAALVLDTLDPAYRIPTRVLAGPVSRRGRVAGPLVLYGMGDPTLGAAPDTADWADQLARQLLAHGIRRVDGDLVADDRYFAGPAIGSGWEAADLQSAFAAPASALSVDENKLLASIAPGTAPGQPARLSFEPAEAAPMLAGQLLTAAAGTPADINVYRAPGSATWQLFGTIAAKAPPRTFALAVDDPAALAGRQLLAAMDHAGIRWHGTLRTVHWPQDDTALRTGTTTVAEVRSPPVREILQQGLKRSQNLYLQNLLQLVGVRVAADDTDRHAAPAGFPSPEARALQALDPLLARAGIPASAVSLSEGTGLSRRDLATPNALVRLLVYLAAQSNANEVRDMLPIAGVDGSLTHRMRGTAAAGNLRAKTGSMTYVSCLAGYVTSAAGERLAFAIMLNNDVAPADAPSANRTLDAIAELLANENTRSP